jgi:type IV secretion system protein VirB9
MIRTFLLACACLWPVAAEAKSPPSQAKPPSARVAAANRSALREPTLSGFVGAAQVYPWAEGATYRLFAAPERVTDIALQAGETLVSVAAGDTARWTVGDTTSGSGEAKRTHILVKPYSAGLRTNLVITTDRRAYHVQLESTTRTAMTALSWTYPEDEMLAIQRRRNAAEADAPVGPGLQLDALSFGYSISGDDPPWRPLRAFDDGRQTFVEFPASIAVEDAPPLFLVAPRGEAELVNYRMRGRFYVVDRLFEAAELRLGTKRQQVVRISRASGKRGKSRRSRRDRKPS